MGKYDPLQTYLEKIEKSSVNVELSFEEIERILGDKLPRSAREFREWWGNQKDHSNRPQCSSWIEAGWEVDKVNFAGKKMTFTRPRRF